MTPSRRPGNARIFRERALEATRGRFMVPDTLGIRTRPLDLCRLVRVVPPGFRDAPGEAGLGRGPSENVPIGDPVRRLVPVRYPVPASADHAVEGAASGDEAGPRVGGDDRVDERIDCRVGHAGKVVRAL